jgi:hypothetical protein
MTGPNPITQKSSPHSVIHAERYRELLNETFERGNQQDSAI